MPHKYKTGGKAPLDKTNALALRGLFFIAKKFAFIDKKFKTCHNEGGYRR